MIDLKDLVYQNLQPNSRTIYQHLTDSHTKSLNQPWAIYQNQYWFRFYIDLLRTESIGAKIQNKMGPWTWMISTTLKKKTSKSQSRWRKNAMRCCTYGALLPPEIFHSRPRQVLPRLCAWCFVALQAAGVVPVVFYIAYGVCSFLIVTFVMPLDTLALPFVMKDLLQDLLWS